MINLKLLKKKIAFLLTKPIDEDLLNALIRVAAARFKVRKRIEGNVYYMYPAELSKCLRITYYKYIYPDIVLGVSPSALAGNIIDEGLKSSIKDFQKTTKSIYMIYKYPVHYEIKLKNGDVLVFSGSVDFIAKNAIIEIKSSSIPKLEIKESDILQTGFYAKAVSLELNKDLDAFIVVTYRNLLFWKIYKLTKEQIEEGFRKIVDNAMILYHALKNEEEPPAKPGFWCSGCPLLPKCKEGQKFITEVMKKDLKDYLKKQELDTKRFIESYQKLLKKSPSTIS